ncbi:ATP-binding protein, partial [Marinitoga arctica]
MRRFCTSGPVDKKTCYYVERPDVMKEALDHIENWRYFTVSAPRQTGKTTLLNDIVEKTKEKYLPIFISFESYGNINEEDFLEIFIEDIEMSLLKIYGDTNIKIKVPKNINNLRKMIREFFQETQKEIVLMIDEFERLDEKIMNEFLHVIRSIYHDREIYKLRSVILISV